MFPLPLKRERARVRVALIEFPLILTFSPEGRRETLEMSTELRDSSASPQNDIGLQLYYINVSSLEITTKVPLYLRGKFRVL